MKSIFEKIPKGPVDPILGTAVAFKNDQNDNKVNLGVGAYRDDFGNPHVFKAVKLVESEIYNNKEYAPIEGLVSILKTPTLKLLFGSSYSEDLLNKIVSVQTISGTGALRVGADFCFSHLQPTFAFISSPTWDTHRTIFTKAGISVCEYPYWNSLTKSLDIDGMVEAFETAPKGSLVVLHACAHNPTGLDPTIPEWLKIIDVIENHQLIPFVDCAYQGFASGDLEEDGWLCRELLRRNLEFFVAQSFAKNLGMYGERIGMLHVVLKSSEIAENVISQLRLVIRPMYSSPPIHGARLVAGVLERNFQVWQEELKQVANRLKSVRVSLRNGLEEKVGGDWSHITKQIGMFSFTGFTENQCDTLINQFHIYLLKNGRISLAGINSSNLQYVLDSFANVIKNS